tara:strand:- start:1331 stop:2272 length:942 start_codon:yes stop_codon:yes gene_type:complete
MIKKTIKNIADFGSTFYNLKGLVRKTKHRLILPFYHLVSDETPKHVQHLYTARRIEKFKEDLDFLLKHYKSISLQELITLNKSGKAITENCFHLTFDDGLKEFYTVVAPMLKERGVHATVFLNADFIDNKELFYRFKASILFDELQNDELLNLKYADKFILDGLANEHKVDFNAYLKKHEPYLTSKQIKELIGKGFTFGAHSKDHPLYKDLDFAEQLSQTQESLATIKSQFNLEYSVFSFPFTDDGVPQQLFNELTKFTDLTFGCAGIKEDSANNHLQRIPMETSQSGKEIIKSEYLYCLIKQTIGKNKIIRQ